MLTHVGEGGGTRDLEMGNGKQTRQQKKRRQAEKKEKEEKGERQKNERDVKREKSISKKGGVTLQHDVSAEECSSGWNSCSKCPQNGEWIFNNGLCLGQKAKQTLGEKKRRRENEGKKADKMFGAGDCQEKAKKWALPSSEKRNNEDVDNLQA